MASALSLVEAINSGRGADESDRPLPEAELEEAVISAQEAADARNRPAARSAAESRTIESRMPVFSTEA